MGFRQSLRQILETAINMFTTKGSEGELKQVPNKFKTLKYPKYIRSFGIYTIPILLLILLVAGHFQSWRSARELALKLTVNRSESVAEELMLRLDLMVQKSSRNLALLANLWREAPAVDQRDTFLKWAKALVISEPAVNLILYLDAGNIMMVTPPELRTATLSGLDIQSRPANEDLFKTLRKSIAPLDAPPTARITSQNGLVLWFPVLIEQPQGPAIAATIAGGFPLKTLITKSLPELTRRDFNIEVSVGGRLIYSSHSVLENNQAYAETADERWENAQTENSHITDAHLSGMKKLNIMGLLWQVRVLPKEGGAFRKLEQSDGIRLGVQVILSFLVSGLLGLSLFALERMRKSRKKEREAAQRLQQSSKMESMGTLAGGIAHDFNNILGSILGFTQMALINTPPGKNRQRLEQIFKASNLAKDLVRQILTFSRRNEETPQPIHIASIVKETLKLLGASIPANISLQYEIEARDGVINADPTRIHQVLTNLCTNGVQAMSPDGGTLTVSLTIETSRKISEIDSINGSERNTAKTAEDRSFVVLTVKDTGTGMDRALQERIFEPYFTTKAPGEGTGMGLAVVHGIVTKYDGFITVDSAPGRGSLIRVFLPAVSWEPLPDPADDKRLPRGTESVLLVDDNPALLAAGLEMLTHLGYRVETCQYPEKALEMIASSPEAFQLLLTDLTMPGMTGTTLAKKVNRINAGIAVILCTGNSHRLCFDELVDSGIREILMKPILLEQLAPTLRLAMGEKPSDNE